MEDINKYIGIPYKFNGRDFNGVDCLGLVWLFYNEHGWIDIDDGLPIEKDVWMKTAARRIVKWFGCNMDKINNDNALKYGDIVIFIISKEIHFGIYIGAGQLLSTQVLIGYENARSTIYKHWQWKQYFKIGFRRR